MTAINKLNIYDKFNCTADKCSLTCCQEWRIGVDEKTLEKWQDVSLNPSYQEGKTREVLCSHVMEEESGHIIRLGHDRKCPFLNKEKLCRLVIELGEDYLSETCTSFPRQINHFEDRSEYSLDPGCPAVVDMIKEEDIHFTNDKREVMPPLYQVREAVLSLIKEEKHSLPERMMMIFFGLLELNEQKDLTEEKIRAVLNEKSLQPVAKAIKKMAFNKGDTFFENNELFLDIIHNYRKQGLYTKYLESIAVLAEELEESYDETYVLEKVKVFEEQLTAFEQLIKKYLMLEIFGNCLVPDMALEDAVMGFEWVALEYAVLKQALFLKWLEQGEEVLTYGMVRDYINIISRVTGYEPGDIREYLENSFESVIWEWGYLALVVGNSRI